MVTMDLQEMRAGKKDLEESVSGVIKEFERKTGLIVREIKITHRDLLTGFPPRLEKSYLSEVGIDVEI